MRKTVNNLVYSLLATVALVAVMIIIVPRSDQPTDRSVDYTAVATQAQEAVDANLANPTLPKSWKANYAEMRQKSSVRSWEIGFLTPSEKFIGFAQGLDANESWVSLMMKSTVPSESRTIDGVTWTVYDNRDSRDDKIGNVHYGLSTQAGSSFFVLFGTAPDEEFVTLATALSAAIEKEANR
ncbi:DUF4245 domain-containing protein [Mycetocola tolaasinivorans]|uniref:DUF4245 domain-containing protein n=2 Tax=Mycetocola tolaasinivorans TaxID=76635 RepID=A0A3L7A8S8_9MICO|nr:DUF4245 domain-containing protein [Mycetocola tolaasinivorans]